MADPLKNEPIKGAKTTFWYYIGRGVGTPQSPEPDWRRLGKVKSLKPGEMKADTEDDSYLDDPDADWKQSSPGQKSVSEASVTLAWMPGDPGQQALMDAFMLGKTLAFRIKYPNDTADFFTGFITNLGKEINSKDVITRDIKIQPSGKPISAEGLIPALTGIKISTGQSADGTAVALTGSQGKWTGSAPVSKGRISLTIEPIPAGAAIPALSVVSSAPDKALIPDATAPDIVPLMAGEAAITISGGGFTDKLTLTLS
ncbi:MULTISPECIES: phage tail tube protein [Edwardsiella]|uniref:Phage major tail protein V n=3 Tax=Edwardsiella TaxID=635 RepID=A0A0H3DUZ2_EDWTF|nr:MULTISPECIES: phage tail tube protein [Edwardsiella]ADM43323.1 phage major tail protein V [Edwardsiella tarda FL6-60]AIJ06989.1 phage major tail protein V [Edwardsiella anguillarum ET080813]AKR78402.1 phage tail protein [Edwardsiella sp. LADL05-105]EKS7794143.1 phage tail protein [Edwardsiella piscicida]ELM3729169.1 phage tail protein [Edwardsiella piscicida]